MLLTYIFYYKGNDFKINIQYLNSFTMPSILLL